MTRGPGTHGHNGEMLRAPSRPRRVPGLGHASPAAAGSHGRAAPHRPGSPGREAEILSLIAQGLNNPEIAARLFVTAHTVKSHINRIFAKTGSRDRAAAIRYAHQHGIA